MINQDKSLTPSPLTALRDSEQTGHLDRLALRRTSYLHHLTTLLSGALLIVRTIHLSSSHVLIHCSDGWDRTSQLSSLSQICLDPYYRTARGFAVLIEKDWLGFGHKFYERTGLGVGDRVAFEGDAGEGAQSAQEKFVGQLRKVVGGGGSREFKETSPVFLQFLDCVWQIFRQSSTPLVVGGSGEGERKIDGRRFEFNEKFLRRLVEELYSGEKGTFFFNSEKERMEFGAKDRTESVWDQFFDQESQLKDEWKNEFYEPGLDDRNGVDMGVLMVVPGDVKWWFELFGRGDEEMNGRADLVFEGGGEEGVVVVVEEGEEGVEDSLTTGIRGVKIAGPEETSTPSISTTISANVPTQEQLTAAVSSVQKFGWGAWKAAQKGYQDYRDASTSSSSASSTVGEGGGHSRTVEGESSGSGWKATEGEELGASPIKAVRTYAKYTPRSSPSTSVPTSPSKPLPTQPSPLPQLPSQQPSFPQPLPSVIQPPRPLISSSPLPAPSSIPILLPTPPPNPWDKPPPPSSVIVKVREKMVEDTSVGGGGGDSDPLGVGFS